jgi:hypothetical protein
MAEIDVQVHAYERNHPGRPWARTPASATSEEIGSGHGRSRRRRVRDRSLHVGYGLDADQRHADLRAGGRTLRNTDHLSDSDRSTLSVGTLQKVYRW